MQKLLYAIGALIVVLIAIGLALPRYARVDADLTIDAHPATVFALVNDFRRINVWSPSINSDPNARVVYAGPRRGVGSAMTWDGPTVGSGTQVITHSRPYEHVATTINAGEPGEAKSWFDLVESGAGTSIRWSFQTDYGYNLIGRYFALIVTSVIQRDYDNGLANLKELVESLPRADFSDIAIERLVVEATEIAYLRATSRPEPAAISEAMGDAYFDVLNFIDRNGLVEAGAPLAITRTFSGAELLFDAAIPVRGVTESTPRDSAGVKIGHTYAGNVIRVRHVGPYRSLSTTHSKIAAYLAALGIERNGAKWESYISDPTKVPEGEILTYVYYPIRE